MAGHAMYGQAMPLTNGNLVAAQLIVKVKGLEQLDQCILKWPDKEGALPAACQISHQNFY